MYYSHKLPILGFILIFVAHHRIVLCLPDTTERLQVDKDLQSPVARDEEVPRPLWDVILRHGGGRSSPHWDQIWEGYKREELVEDVQDWYPQSREDSGVGKEERERRMGRDTRYAWMNRVNENVILHKECNTIPKQTTHTNKIVCSKKSFPKNWFKIEKKYCSLIPNQYYIGTDDVYM